MVAFVLVIIINRFGDSQSLAKMSELYFFFTDYMKDEVDSHLQLLNCIPSEYYYENYSVCFVCGDVHPCFGYALVGGKKGKKMNPRGAPYLKTEEIETEIADFFQYGLASEFKCNKKNENELECDNDLIFIKNDLNVKMFTTDTNNFEETSRRICTHFSYELEKCEELSCECGEMLIVAKQEDGEIILVW